ncbi:fatty acid hydroxylase superfamily-domain-containing protein [Russula earlei]|uniref:Fatty acid hydroxylase superfamily-domain-containing protein n=1 Tax=Russula earlei TaxID=71964 RepID=A0ACC0U5H3_9AGAM|nr:fatty acid hydroxylase superfamily-domain-containing protein [Russula earlei]
MSSSVFNYNLTGPPLPPDHLLYHSHPRYYSPAPSLFPPLSDSILTVLSPLPAYWITAFFFFLLDSSNLPWIVRMRINESSEVTARNRASRLEVLRSVLFMQFLQTALGLFWVADIPRKTDHAAEMRGIAHRLMSPLGVFDDAAAPLAYMVYWWFVPAVQLLTAMVVLDSWQYVVHRTLHSIPFLYKHFHSVHHRLYVPYAYGTLYTHPVEGFVLDSVGAMIANTVTGLSLRQSMLFFVLTTCKAVDDHCGYRLPFDPLQFLSGNTAEYHDIHHQAIGIKYNFSQPWFIHWDVILGTRITTKGLEERRVKLKAARSAHGRGRGALYPV